MDDVTRPEDLEQDRTGGARPDPAEDDDCRETAGRRPDGRDRADREPSAIGGEQEAGQERAPR